MNKPRLRFFILISFIIGAAAVINIFDLGHYFGQEFLRGWIGSFGSYGPLVYIFIYSIAPVLMIPGLPITVAGGVLFGPFWGSLYVLSGATIGAGLAFLIARYLGRSWVASRLRGARLRELDSKVREQGWKIVAFTRLIPVFPYTFLNYGFGLTGISFLHYLVASAIFMIPGTIAYVVFSSSLLDLFEGRITREFVIGAVLLIFVTVLPLIYRKIKAKKV